MYLLSTYYPPGTALQLLNLRYLIHNPPITQWSGYSGAQSLIPDSRGQVFGKLESGGLGNAL